LLHYVVDKSIDQITGALPETAHVVVTVKFPDYEWFIRHRIVDILTESGFSVAGIGDTETGEYYTLEVGVERFDVTYSDVKRRSFLGSRVMTRQADGVFSFRINGPDRERILRISESVSDVIPYGRQDAVENRALPFTQAALPGGSLTERYLGPAVIIAATGVVVYLFFSVRS